MGSALASGLFYTVSAVFFTRVIGLTVTTVGLGLTVAGAVGVAGAFGAGYLADRVGAHRLMVAATAGQGLALLAYAAAASTATFITVACAAVGLRAVQGTARAALIASRFTGADRVSVRAGLSVVTNVFIGLGTCLAAVALLADTDAAYTAGLLTAGAVVLLSCAPLLPVLRLPGPVARAGNRAHELGRPGRSPLRDPTYLGVAALNAVLTMHLGLQTVGVPLWIITRTDAPPVTVSLLLALNTTLVALFQVRAARGTHDIRTAARGVAAGGSLLAGACALYATAAVGGSGLAVLLLVLAALAHTAGEMWAEAGSWGLAYELADPDAAGAYQGVNQTSVAVGAMLAPLVVTATALEHRTVGWAVLGSTFALAGVLTLLLVRRQHAQRTFGHQYAG
ncbi:MFS transporter [Micromonospora sp. NPDC047670]|uniref:MFS transporter n=1 Tax=Micromonospora sp. NPDC047670 TaxID=3364252 RepID=UPI0037171733